jgi:arylsulfatase A-like enzyme
MISTRLIAFPSWLLALFCLPFAAIGAAERPNILWLTSEDHGPQMGCYGDELARTPNIDGLAAAGMRYQLAWSVAPVCAPARTAIITGVYPSSAGGLHMRSMVPMSGEIQMYPELLRAAGYYCTNNAKTDYNLREPARLWNESSENAHWRRRPDGQPFFAVFNSGRSHESRIRDADYVPITDPAAVRVPPYHPDTPEVRRDWAQYYDRVSEADAELGERLREIEAAGLAEDTIVFFYADHGGALPRGKRWPGNSGLQVPLVVYFPPKWQHLAPAEYRSGGVSERLVSFIDLAPTLLSLIGQTPPEWMHGHAFAGPRQTEGPALLFGERGRMDERFDLVRGVTDGRFVYLRNFMPHLPHGQVLAYQMETPTTRLWRELFLAGKTNEVQSAFWQAPRSTEELYDLSNDPDETVNLANSPAHRETVAMLRAALFEHLRKIRDVSFLPEAEMHRRSAGSSPYDLGRDPARYPLERILAAADLASNFDPSATDRLVELLSDEDSAVRYWGALGLLMRGEMAVQAGQDALLKRLDDESPDTRIAAAQALARYGDSAARSAALEILKALASPQENGTLVAITALAAIEALGAKAAPLRQYVIGLNPAGPSPHGRYSNYPQRLIKSISEAEARN